MIQFIILFIPAFMATLIYEKLGKQRFSLKDQIVITLCFSLIINMLSYAVVWLRGYGVIDWSLSGDAANVAFCLKYMAISILFAGLTSASAAGLQLLKDDGRLWLKK